GARDPAWAGRAGAAVQGPGRRGLAYPTPAGLEYGAWPGLPARATLGLPGLEPPLRAGVRLGAGLRAALAQPRVAVVHGSEPAHVVLRLGGQCTVGRGQVPRRQREEPWRSSLRGADLRARILEPRVPQAV